MNKLALTSAFLLTSTALLPLPAFAQDGPAAPGLEAEQAAPGTPDEAAALRQALEAYLTDVPFQTGILDVEPGPAGQRIVIQPADFLSDLVGAPVRFEPLSLLVSEREDGNWNVFSDDALDAGATFEWEGGAHEEEYRQDWQVFKGIFSPELGTFLSLEGHSGPTTQVSRDDFSTTVVGFVGSVIEMTAQPVGVGAADIDFRQSYDSYAQSIAVEIPMEETGGEPFGFSFDLTVESMETYGTIGAMQARAMLDLQAAILAHAGELMEDANAALAGPAGEEIKQALRSALPLWGEMDIAADANDFTLASLYGDLTVAQMTQTARMSGIDTDAFFETDLALSGIAADSAFMPDWAVPLAPHSIEFGFSVSDVDLATPLEVALREVDFSNDDLLTQDALAELIEAFGIERITARIEPSRIEAQTFQIAFEGDLTLAAAVPEARLSIEMHGLDETIAALQAAADGAPELYEAVGMLQIAKGFSRAGDEGQALWLVEAFGDGSVLLNGTMLKGPDEAPDTDGSPSDDL